LLFLDEFALDHDLDLVADDKLAIEHHVEHQAVVLPVDLALGAVADAVAHHGVVEFPYFTTFSVTGRVLPLMVRSPSMV